MHFGGSGLTGSCVNEACRRAHETADASAKGRELAPQAPFALASRDPDSLVR